MHAETHDSRLGRSHERSDLVERLRAAITVAGEYACELEGMERSEEQRRSERVRRLLTGERVSSAELGYELDALHLGVIAQGPEAARTVEDLAGGCDRELLLVVGGDEVVWGWLGGQGRQAPEEIERALAGIGGVGKVSLAVGEPGGGVEGWCGTHRQAQAALTVALSGPPGLTRFADVALFAPMLGDPALGGWLVESFLAPLDDDEGRSRNDGALLRETLRAYFLAGRRPQVAAHALGVSRRTVANRLQTVELRLGRPLETCLSELEVALRVEQLGATASSEDWSSSTLRASGEET